MPSTLTPHAFVAKWRSATLKERSAAQEHFIDVCQLIGHPTPAEADPTGERFTFEAGASKQGGGSGWADVWKRGAFAWEYKGKHADLARAYDQLLKYREALHNPPLLVVCDIETIQVHTNFTNSVKQVTTLTFDDLLTPAGVQRLRDIFTNPDAFRAAQTTEQVTQQAAAEFARLAEGLRRWGEEPQMIAHFLIRLLFCLFAEDVNLLPNKLFTRLITATRSRPRAFVAQLQQLFAAMRSGGDFALEQIAYFNGGLFDNDTVLELDSDGLDILARVAQLDWSSIEPSIFGTLFERSLDPSKRAQLGAHYTSRDDILLIVEPVLMQPLRRRWEAVQTEACALAARRDAATDPGQRTRLHNELARLLTGFAYELSQVRVLDPACGSGNFLYVALKQLLDLEKQVITEAADLHVGTFSISVGPEQLYGIEVNAYAHELAAVTVWIGFIQWLRENGFGAPAEPILKPLDTIRQMDAVLAFDPDGRPVEPAWPAADIIIGNPPFLGGNKIRQELGDHYVEALFKLYEGRVPAFADLVAYWFERARALIADGKTQRAGLLATNSIRGGANRKVLERIKQTGDIFMAWSDRPWVLNGAAVRVSMVGFDGGAADTNQPVGADQRVRPEDTHNGPTHWSAPTERLLNGQPVAAINPDLTGAVDLTAAQHLPENEGICFMGPSPKAPFDIDRAVAHKMLAAPININGRPNSDVVRPVASAVDLVQRSRQKWTIDFGLMPLEQASEYEAPFEYVRQHVYPIRTQNRRASYAEKWWQYAEARPGMRKALNGKSRYIATPAVAKHRIFVWMPPEVLCNQGTLVFAREDDYFMGVLHSRLHDLWALRMGTSLEDRPRYTPTTTFETFPFPWPPGAEPPDDPRVAAIAAAARDLVAKRDRWPGAPTPVPSPKVGGGVARSDGVRAEGTWSDGVQAEGPPVAPPSPDPQPPTPDPKRTLTNLYNARPTWLVLAHQTLDRAVLDAYGWPHDLTDDEILTGLLALNAERAAR